MDLESRMRKIQENEYLRLTSNLWYDRCTKIMTSGARREIVTWVLNTAQLEDQGQGGNVAFDDMVILETEFTPKTAGKGLKLRRQQFEDLDGNGVELASEWSAQMGAQHAYWPQKQVATMLKNGALASALGYDGKPFFSALHPVNPNNTSAGTFSNLFTGVPIDASVTPDVALANLATVFSNIASIKMPNGSDPRMLRPAGILTAPKLFPRAIQLTNARVIAQAAATGGGGADVDALIRSLGYGQPICADEFAGFESDTTYFVIAEQVTSSQLGGLVYVDRESFSTRYYTGRGGGNGVDAVLDRADELEWHTSGRNIVGYGHPFTVFKCTA
jgi:phage major head subunit gpT-like protein